VDSVFQLANPQGGQEQPSQASLGPHRRALILGDIRSAGGASRRGCAAFQSARFSGSRAFQKQWAEIEPGMSPLCKEIFRNSSFERLQTDGRRIGAFTRVHVIFRRRRCILQERMCKLSRKRVGVKKAICDTSALRISDDRLV
jgi:hypothetical protein